MSRDKSTRWQVLPHFRFLSKVFISFQYLSWKVWWQTLKFLNASGIYWCWSGVYSIKNIRLKFFSKVKLTPFILMLAQVVQGCYASQSLRDARINQSEARFSWGWPITSLESDTAKVFWCWQVGEDIDLVWFM